MLGGFLKPLKHLEPKPGTPNPKLTYLGSEGARVPSGKPPHRDQRSIRGTFWEASLETLSGWLYTAVVRIP